MPKKKNQNPKMIKNDDNYIKISLDSILGEIVNISNSLGEYKSSINHIESSISILSNELNNNLNEIYNRINSIEKYEYVRKKRSDFFWKLLKISPFDIFKWIFSFGIILYFLSLSFQINFTQGLEKMYQLMVK